MKFCIFLTLILTSNFGYNQQLDSLQKSKLSQLICSSKEVKEWQDAMISFQKVNNKFCALKHEQKLHQNLFSICDKQYSIDLATENFVLELFRTMRITNKLKKIVETKKTMMRKNHPEISTCFKGDEIFHQLYAPILEARESLRKTTN